MRRFHKPAALALALAGSVLLLAGCGSHLNDAREVWRDARARWTANRPSQYTYTLERLCFCPEEVRGPVRIVVRGDSVLSRAYVGSGQAVPAQYAVHFGTIESLFDVIDDAIDRKAAELSTQYDPARGYPLTVNIDYVANAIDEELGLRVSEFLIPPAP